MKRILGISLAAAVAISLMGGISQAQVRSGSTATRNATGTTSSRSGPSSSSSTASSSSDNRQSTATRSSSTATRSTSTATRSATATTRSSSQTERTTTNAKTTTTGSSVTGRRATDRNETRVSNSNVTNKGLSTYSAKQAKDDGKTTNNSPAARNTSTAVRSNPNVSKTAQGVQQQGGALQSPTQQGGRQSAPKDTYTDRAGNYRYGGANNMDVRGDNRDVNRMHPYQRPPITYDRPYGFTSRKPHYYGYNVQVIPVGYQRRTLWGTDFYYYNGIYYRMVDNYYRVSRPPFGITIRRPLCGRALTSVLFSYYTTVERPYAAINANYATIAEQNAIIARNNAIIAQQNALIALNGTTASTAYALAAQMGLIQSYADARTPYYYQDGVFYTVHGRNYTTILPPAGAIIASLPDDYTIFTYGGNRYYRMDNTVFRTIVYDGAPYFEVLGQYPYWN